MGFEGPYEFVTALTTLFGPGHLTQVQIHLKCKIMKML